MKRILFFIFVILSLRAEAQFGTTKDQWRLDLRILRNELPKRHPNMFVRISKSAYEAAFDELMTRVDGLPELGIALEAQSILARVGDSQTRLDLTRLLQRERGIPIGFGYYAEGMFVSGTVKKYQSILGTRVISINGLEPDAALKRLARFTPVENGLSLRRDALVWLRFPVVFRAVGLSDSDTLRLVVEDAAGKRIKVSLTPFDLKAADPKEVMPAVLMRGEPDLRWRSQQLIYDAKWLDKDSILYFQYNQAVSREMALESGDTITAYQLPEFAPWADSLIQYITTRPGAKLFVDLRFNTGGGASDLKILADRLARLPEINRKDRLFVAVNSYTALAAVEIAQHFRAATRATILGDPPAQLPNHSGRVMQLKLPNTQLDVYFSSDFPTPEKGSQDRFQPDVLVEQTFADFREGKDTMLDYVRKTP